LFTSSRSIYTCYQYFTVGIFGIRDLTLSWPVNLNIDLSMRSSGGAAPARSEYGKKEAMLEEKKKMQSSVIHHYIYRIFPAF
jgi:hypothetical protein